MCALLVLAIFLSVLGTNCMPRKECDVQDPSRGQEVEAAVLESAVGGITNYGAGLGEREVL